MNARLAIPLQPDSGKSQALRLRIGGHVQGVGFRPFVYRLAHRLSLTGTVQNLCGDVEIVVQGSGKSLQQFLHELISAAPPLARPQILDREAIASAPRQGFAILGSESADEMRIFVPADAFTCDDCLAELCNATGRRFRYPFINCTQCGPRYTLIKSLPYDRPNTTMSSFGMCPECSREYSDPLDRRFHAQPIACPACGPELWLEEAGERQTAARALARAVALLREGGCIAAKGIGGYHLLCDARNEQAVQRLRLRKRRPHKPLAVMFPQAGASGLDCVRSEVRLSDGEAQLLVSAARPIVLLQRRSNSALAPAIAPGLAEVGVFLPYSPLHHLLLTDFGGPLVATSANLSGEPLLTEAQAVRTALKEVVDAGLHHNRPIARPADDSVVRHLLGQPRILRLGRGLGPLEIELPRRMCKPTLAVGGHLKTTVALAWDNRAVISPHIGDMGTTRSEQVFTQVAEDLQRLYGVQAAQLACDLHPRYATTRWAQSSGLPLTYVQHHHAHASALAAEHDIDTTMLVFTWDGVGLGTDETLWGGETFLGSPGQWRRVASLRPFKLPGGEGAGRAPWRSAAALCWEVDRELPNTRPDPLVRQAWERNLNCPSTSAAGRLFDAAASLMLGVHETSYEGQGPMMLEAVAAQAGAAMPECEPLKRVRQPDRAASGTYICMGEADDLCRIDWAPLVAGLLDNATTMAMRAARFHATLAATILAIAEEQREMNGVDTVGLTGGVFQNALLTRWTHSLLSGKGFVVRLAERVPCNDGGLCFGQIIECMGCASPHPMREGA